MSFIPDFIYSQAFEKLNKQIAAKVPYALLISAFIYLLGFAKEFPFLLVSAIIFAATFVVTNTYFNSKMNKIINKGFFDRMQFAEGYSKLREVVQGEASMLGDIQSSQNKRTYLPAALAGCSLMVSLTFIFLFILDRIQIDVEILVPSMIAISIFIYYDLLKSPLKTEDDRWEEKNPAAFDFFEQYFSNSLKPKTRIPPFLLRFVGRVFGPVLELQVPKLKYDTLMYYRSKDLVRKLLDFSNENGHDGMFFRRIEGLNLNKLLEDKVQRRSPKIHTLSSGTASEIFPYIFSPNKGPINNNMNRIFGVYTMNIDNGTRIIGQVHIHLFMGPKIIQKYKLKKSKNPWQRKSARSNDSPIEREFKEEPVFLFMLFGERKYTNFLKSQFDTIAIKFQSDLLKYEVEEYSE